MTVVDKEKFDSLAKEFYNACRVRLVLYDETGTLIYKAQDMNPICTELWKSPTLLGRCREANMCGIRGCYEKQGIHIYTCHIGFREVVTPVRMQDVTIGYLMFGQLADVDSKAALYQTVEGLCEKYGFEKATLTSAVDTLTCKSEEEIAAAAKIMEACTSYIIYKELITPENNRIIEAAKAYIEAHPEMQTDVTALCGELGVGRTRLYELFKAETGMGVAAYIRRRKMHRAKKLLKTTTLSIDEIAQAVGFADYNYFSRVYKKTYGKSPKRYR